MLAAFDARDADAYADHLAEDVVVRPPGLIIGSQEHRGREQARGAFRRMETVLARAGRSIEFRKRRYFLDQSDDTKVLVVIEIDLSTLGENRFGSEAAVLVTVTDGLASRIESWTSEAAGLAHLRDPIKVEM